ncbi:hypothetical protein KP696_37495 [Nocardia seriolae]|nr:hypothetical protein [Nocardia seriolae]MTJ73144.1 hypothetical protein [Nocardia seriolae]MTJ89169.1 hypothetical protein [Nocardia seriolae]MTK33147.1 hypothetical protein [Nocardia seriolae]MTK42102.1 hypothetical protein [Nocardia seriolae]
MLRRRLAWRGGPSQVVMVVLSVAMLATACGSGSTGGGSKPTAAQPPTSTTRLLEVAPAPDPTTADGVAVTALEQIYTWYPATESEGDALRRARKWLGPSLIRVLDTPTGSVETPRPVLRWTEWAKAGAHVEAFAFASGEKAPAGADPNRQQFKIGIEQTVVYPDGKRESLPPATVVATVVRGPTGGWLLDEFR